MPRPAWSDRYLNKAHGRERFRHPKIYTPTPESRPSQTWRVPRGVWVGGGVGVALLGLAGLLLSPAFQIEKIEVVGDVTPPVRAEIDRLYGRNLLLYSAGSMTERLRSAQSSIRDLVISKGLPDTLRVELSLREPVVAWRSGESVYLVDGKGVPFQITGANPAAPLPPTIVDTFQQPVVTGQPLLDPNFVAIVDQLADDFPDRFPVEVERFEVGETTFELRLVTKAGWSVLFDTTRSIEPQLVALGEVFEAFHGQIKESVDLRVEGRAFFR